MRPLGAPIPARDFDAGARKWDAWYEAESASAHRIRVRAAAAARLVGTGPGSLLEVGMGGGRLLALLAGDGWKVTGIDAAPGMVELARARIPAEAARLAVEPAERLSWEDAEFEAAVAVGVLEYTVIDSSLRELARVLRPGGRLVIGFRNRAAPMHAWRRVVVHPTARAVKRFVRFGRPPPMRRPRPLSMARIRATLAAAGFLVEHVETVGVEVIPDPLDHLAPKLALRAARRAEGSAALRRALGADRLVVARRRGGRAA